MSLQEFLAGTQDSEAANIKEATAELVGQFLTENELSPDDLTDEELRKVAEYVLTQGESADEEKVAEAEAPEVGADEQKVAEYDEAGRIMARAFMDEQIKLAHALETGDVSSLDPSQLQHVVQTKVASAQSDVATFWEESLAQESEKVAKKMSKEEFMARIGKKGKDGEKDEEKDEDEEKSAALQFVRGLTGDDFAKLAEFRAGEILAANGIDPTDFSEIEPVEVKLAEFPLESDAETWSEKVALKQYNQTLDEAAMHILSSLGFAEG